MSKKANDNPEIRTDSESWKALLEQARTDAWASETLTEEEKRLLDEMDNLPDDQWEPITCEGKPISETIIEDRGEK